MNDMEFQNFLDGRTQRTWDLDDGVSLKLVTRTIGNPPTVSIEYGIGFIDQEGPLYVYKDIGARDWSIFNWKASTNYHLVSDAGISKHAYLKEILAFKKEVESDSQQLIRECRIHKGTRLIF